MAERRFQRFDVKQDVYIYHGVSKYEGRLENISCSGALVVISNFPELMEIGDMCHLAFAANPEAILCGCTVVRMISSSVGLQFIETTATA
jgi:PilZ domain